MVGKFLEYTMNNYKICTEPVSILQAFQLSLVRIFSIFFFCFILFFLLFSFPLPLHGDNDITFSFVFSKNWNFNFSPRLYVTASNPRSIVSVNCFCGHVRFGCCQLLPRFVLHLLELVLNYCLPSRISLNYKGHYAWFGDAE